MKISLDHIGKRFGRTWIFKDLHQVFNGPDGFALLGPNGSGKSTLLRIIGGIQLPSQGKIAWELGGKVLPAEERFEQISFCSPGMDLPEEFNLEEFFHFHFQFKKPAKGLDCLSIIDKIGLKEYASRPLEDFSSGMKQRVKLAQAIFSDTPILLLDEPCTNLDETGVSQYQEWMQEWGQQRLVLVASNDPREYAFCSHQIRVSDFQPGVKS